jgi:hypothetical protein
MLVRLNGEFASNIVEGPVHEGDRSSEIGQALTCKKLQRIMVS